MRYLREQPIRRQVVGLSCLLLLPVAAGIVWSANRTRLERQGEVRAETVTVATTAAAHLDQHLRTFDALASALVRHPAVQALDGAVCTPLFAELLREQPVLTNVLLAGPDGVVHGSALQQGDGRTSRPWLNDVLTSGEPRVGPFGIGTVSGKPTVTLAYPVRAGTGPIKGVLALTMNLAKLDTFFDDIPLPAGSVVTVVDRDRRVLARSREATRYVGTRSEDFAWTDVPRSAERVGTDGVDRFYGDAPLHRAPWLLSVGIPRTEVADRLFPLWRRNIAIAIATVALSLLFSLWLAQVMSRQLNRLRAAVQNIANGDLTPPVPAPMPNRELAQLQNAFVTMAANLRTTHEALDRQVEQERRMNEALQSLQMQVVRQERLAAVGLLVSGVAHELNNPLQAILGTTELLERQPAVAGTAPEELSVLKTQSGRACEIIRNLSRFSHQKSGPPEILDLGDVIAEIVQLRKGDLDSAGIALEVRIGSGRKVYANFTEMEQVTLNFVINAQQALEYAHVSGGRIRIRLLDEGKNVRLEVSDNGPGVATVDQPKLFQPFFTTKPVGKGTGLGLSVSYGIIDAYGGTIGYADNEWGGATFYFELPAIDVEAVALYGGPALLRRPV